VLGSLAELLIECMGEWIDGVGCREAAPKESIGGAGICRANCRNGSEPY
jgi:hypothetical protein